MKLWIRLALFLLLTSGITGVRAQNNVIKGRVLALPLSGLLMYSAALGYERVMGNHLSLQVLFNHSGLDNRGHDGNAEIYTSLTPELRYYFATHQGLASAFFLAPFAEMQHRRILPGGEDIFIDSYFVNSYQHQISPGLLLGKNFRLSPNPRRLHLELYLGAKYRMGRETIREVINNQSIATTEYYRKYGIRPGINLAYRF
jgi:hypothetical protein